MLHIRRRIKACWNNLLETKFYLENEDFSDNEKLNTNISKWLNFLNLEKKNNDTQENFIGFP